MRHYCRTCRSASVFRETDDHKQQSYFCGKARCWITAKNPDGYMDHCTGWSWKGLQTLQLCLSIGVFLLCIGVIITILVLSILMVVTA